MSASFAHNSPVGVARVLQMPLRLLSACTVLGFGVAATLIVSDWMSVSRAVLIGIAAFSSTWAASTLGALSDRDTRRSSVELTSGILAALVALICVLASGANDDRSRTLTGIVAVTLALLLWLHAALVADRAAAFEASVGTLALLTAAAGLVLLSLGLDNDIRSDGAGLLIATMPPLAAALLIARNHRQAIALLALLGVITGVMIREGDDLTLWTAGAALAVLVYVADARLPARSNRSQLAICTTDALLVGLVGVFVAAYLAFRMDEPVRGFLLGAIAALVSGVSLIQRSIISEREQRLTELAMIADEIRERARLDPLTGLPNRAALDARMLEEVERAVRYRQPLSVLFIDIDHFKAINDTRGHQVGDEVLSSMASVIRATVRTPDFVARYGGEEFVVIAPATWTADAATLGQRIQAAVAMHAPQPLGEPVTISVGIAGVPEHGRDTATVLRVADLALYAAKFAGRNRVAIGIDSPPLGPA